MQGMNITVVGNLVDDPELRFTSSGTPVCNFRLAVSNRVKDAAGEWQDGEPSFFKVAVWREYGEHVAESLRKGDQVFVYGKLMTRAYEDREGSKRVSVDVTADEVGPTLRWATARVAKVPRSAPERQGQGGQKRAGDFADPPPF
jgi:single-strand DNA-binding protein